MPQFSLDRFFDMLEEIVGRRLANLIVLVLAVMLLGYLVNEFLKSVLGPIFASIGTLLGDRNPFADFAIPSELPTPITLTIVAIDIILISQAQYFPICLIG
jgi:hypothetical protein